MWVVSEDTAQTRECLQKGVTYMRVKRKIYSGAVCEQIVYNVCDSAQDLKKAKPRLRFKDNAERAAHRLAISRRNHARLINENFHAGSLYVTLTLDDEHEVHTFKDAKRIRDNYMRRLQYACPDAKITAYLGRGKSTHRIHMHMLIDGVPEDLISAKWGKGNVLRIEQLREHNYYNNVDHGQDFTGLANYLFDHWTEDQGGHRWKGTKNLRKPQKDEVQEAKRNYSEDHPPITPKGYMLVETKATKYGYLYFKYIKIPPKKSRKKPSES